MHSYARIYDFASSVGAFEGYVYKKRNIDDLDMTALSVWVDQIVSAYKLIPQPVLDDLQPLCDQTLGRAKKSLVPVLGESHAIVKKLDLMIVGPIPNHPDDFQKTKWFQENKV